MKRFTAITRVDRAGCVVCHGSKAQWVSPNARALAARHHDLTRHETWFEVSMTIRYGHATPDDRQIDIEAAIAASSGGAPQCAPLTVFDASAGATANVSTPIGRSSKPALAAAPPEHPSS